MSCRTAIVTWTSHRNFGTYLQAYALQRVIKELGFPNRILDDSVIIGNFAKKRFSPLRWLRNQPWLYPSGAEFRHRYQSALKEYEAFRIRHMMVDSDWHGDAGHPSGYDLYIAGSDQIWSPNVPFSDYYYLGGVDGRKVSYAPSFGASDIPDAHLDRIAGMIAEFESLSVREPVAAARLEERLGLKAQVTADPTMLLDVSEWNALLSEEGIDCRYDGQKYALCYLLSYNAEYLAYVRRYCTSRGLKLKVLAVNEKMMGAGDEDICTGPVGFIDAVRKAEVVFTDSFHGSIFSVLYSRNLLIFKRFASDSQINQNSRVEFLAQKLGLSGRLVDVSGLSDFWEDDAIDYEKVSCEVERFRNESLNYIKSFL